MQGEWWKAVRYLNGKPGKCTHVCRGKAARIHRVRIGEGYGGYRAMQAKGVSVDVQSIPRDKRTEVKA